LLIFSVTPFKINKNKNQKSSKARILKRKKVNMQSLSPRFRSQQCFLRKICGEFFTQIYRDFDGDAMLAPIWMAAGNQQKHLSLSFATKA